MLRRDYGPKNRSETGQDRQDHVYEHEEHDNGATGGNRSAPGSPSVADNSDWPSISEALEMERRRNATLLSKLRKERAKNKKLTTSNARSTLEPPHFQSTLRNDQAGGSFNGNESFYASMNNLSYATLNVTECKPGDGEDEIDRRSFEIWRGLLEASMKLVGATDEETKMSIFKIKAGSKLLEILEETVSSPSNPSAEIAPYSNAVARLKDHFGSREYCLLQRQKLRSLTQSANESDVKYVKRVINLARLCNFSEDQLLENVADVIQSHALKLKVREMGRKILRKGGTIPDLLEKVRAFEIGNLNEELFAKSHQQNQAQVAALSTGRPSVPYQSHFNNRRVENDRSGSVHRPVGLARSQGRFFNNQQRSGNQDQYRRYESGSARPKCWRCLSTMHTFSNCPVSDKVCRSCLRQGHIARACTESREPTKRKSTTDGDAMEGPSAKKIATISEEEFVEDKIATKKVVNCLPGSRGRADREAYIRGYIAGLPITFLIDSGAEVNTINGDLFRELMNNDTSRAAIFDIREGSDRPLRAYATDHDVKVLSTFVAELFISDDRPRSLEKFYAVDNAKSLLSRNTAIRYCVLQIGLGVPIANTRNNDGNPLPGEILLISGVDEFPKFNVEPVILTYDQDKPPSRNIYTNIPPAFKMEAQRRMGELLSAGIIEKVTDIMEKSFCSSLLVVPKGKDDIRLVVDLRGPNKSIVRTPFKMPTLEAILAELHGATVFTTLDLKSAFFHVVLDEKSRHLTNFYAGDATYRFKRLPFGLCNAPDIFQEICQTVILSGCRGVRNYLDDILVHGKNKEEHDKNLQEVLRRLNEHNVSLNKEKCVFGKNSVKFLGFTLSHDGLKIEEEKLKAIKNFRRPESQSEVKSFLGLINFVERFIPGRADKTERLRGLSKSERYYWTEKEEEEFLYLKDEALSTVLKLGYFSSDDETDLFVDASPIGLGAVLVQYDKEGVPRIISCASKALTDAEKKYPQTQKEALAIVWGVERFSFYLTSKSFCVRTDSEANEFIFGEGRKASRRTISRAEAWALRLQPFDFTMKRIPGDLNVADTLSRLIDKAQLDAPFDESDDRHVLYALDAGLMDITWTDIEQASESDSELSSVREALGSKVWSPSLRQYELHKADFRCTGAIVFKQDKIVLPESLRRQALESSHQGHLGIAAMKRIIREYFWWPGISDAVEQFVKSCKTCLIISRRNPPIPLSSRTLPDGPWEILQVDFLTVRGCGSGEFLIVVDTYSRFLSVVEVRTIDAKCTNAALLKVFETWGLPMIMQSDNGPPFRGSEFIEHWEQKGVRIRKSIPLSAQSNGAVERQNQGILKAIAGSKQDGENWRMALHKYVHVHNTIKPHSRIGITPFELLVGWKYRGTFPALWETRSNRELDRNDVREHDSLSKMVSQEYADRRRGAKPSDIKAGDKVVVAVAKSNKTDPLFSKERYTVLVREGAKVVIQSNRGVQYARNVQDVKRAMDFDASDAELVDEAGNGVGNIGEEEAEDRQRSIAVSLPDEKSSITEKRKDSSELIGRPKRDIKRPERYNDMFVYRIF